MSNYSYNNDPSTHPGIELEVAEQLAALYGALGDPTRVRIIAALVEGELNVQTITERVKLSQSAISHQLQLLKQMNLVKARKDGRQVFYRLQDEHILDLYQRGLEHILHE
jgi:ArsR family transcriptional regulator, lead/cadmium/zinc/bismuth-responsive transcriptional repressor